MKSSILLSVGLVALAPLASAQQFNEASEEAQQRVESAQQEYAELQERIAPQKAELGARLALLEEELRKLQSEFSTVQRVADTSGVEVNQLDREIASLEDTNSYIQSTLFNEYIRRLQLTLDPAERSLYDDPIRDALEIVDTREGVEVSQSDIFRTQLEALDVSFERIEEAIGGRIIEGSAELDGNILEGSFALFGPNTFFAGPDGAAGIVNAMKANSTLPNIFPLPDYAEGIQELVETGSATVPVDATGSSRSGNMESLRTIDTQLTLMGEFRAGGPTMYAIWGLLIVGVLISLFKFIELIGVRRVKESDLETVLRHLREGNRDAALSHAKSIGGPAGRLLTAAVENAEEDKEVIEEVLYEVIVKTQPKLERFLPFIAVAAATAPLLGLLGTVTGMIKTFKLITIVGTGDAQSLSSGISEALITTKWGLITAIPTLMLHAILNRMAKGVVGSMEQTAVGFLNGISAIRESEQP
ncbi:MAG: MotA/TolQ/ExbB proton channel family protein [Opitutales bacterium]